MKKAYIVSIYNHVEYANNFIRQLLSDGTSDVWIHVDKKYDELKENIISHPRIFFVKNNQQVEWGGYSFLMAILASFREVVEHEGYDYVILCSGQDLMVKKGIDEFLNQNYGQIYIDSWEDDKYKRAFLLYKWPKRYFRIINKKLSLTRIMRALRIKLFRTGIPLCKRNIKCDTSAMTFYTNRFWSCLPYEFVKWVLHYLDEHPDYIEVFKGFVAEEGFITTTIMLSPYKNKLQFDERGKSHSLTYTKPFVNNHPPIITKDDIEKIEKSGCFFVRKVDETVDNDVISYFMNKSGIDYISTFPIS